MLDLRSIARALGGEVSAGQVVAPGPGHGPSDRSMSVKPSTSASDGFLVFSHAGDDGRDCRDHVRRVLGIERERGPATRREAPRRPPEARPQYDDGRSRALAI
jgi:putative DNA primase/helicase